jgi:CRISPR system Cascade subunit CasE
MSDLHLLRIPVNPPHLLRFASQYGITQEDETLGYVLHAWLMALFGKLAPKPFRYIDRRREVLAYASSDAKTLLDHAQTFASPQAWVALDPGGMASKPMPTAWKVGQHLRLEVITCPVSRQGEDEKDLYLRALDHLGEAAPSRAAVYQKWFVEQWTDTARIDRVELLGLRARTRLLRRARNATNHLRIVERPQALFGADAVIIDVERFAQRLSRGVGRHRAFGFGMVLLAPPR